jgi:NAD(P)-dependent dehydrogenase (short-subunit alcohol dehydrogenase family)
VTGANSGIGLQIAIALAAKGAHVVLAVRDLERGRKVSMSVRAVYPHASLELQQLDLTSLRSIRDAATHLKESHPRIDLLINNAGVMFTPRHTTADGFELQFGTNHLGHFALTGLLIKQMLGVPGSRVVTISSHGHKTRPEIDFDDLHAEGKYDRVAAYGRSKLANLLFTYELQRRLKSSVSTAALAAHPGFSRSNLAQNSPAILRYGWGTLGKLLLQSARMGALPSLRAATDPMATGGQYYRPGGLGEYRGYPKVVESSAMSRDESLQRRLWSMSEELTAVTYPL